MKTMYQTKDGELFESQETARQHECKLFMKWLEQHPSVNICDVMNALENDTSPNEYWGAPSAVLRDILQKFFDNHVL